MPILDVDKSNDLVPTTAGADVDGMDTDAIGADAVDTKPLDVGAEPDHTNTMDADFDVEDVDGVDTDVMDTDAIGADTVDTKLLDVGAEPDHTNNVHTDATDADFGVEPNPNRRLYYAANAAFLSDGSAAVLPCTIRYMDLTVLKLKHLTHVPHVMLIRDDWKTVVDIFNEREKGILGSAAITGQPGIGEHRYCSWPPIFNQRTNFTGKTCLLFYIVILCIIRAQPIVFQDKAGGVFLISDKVPHKVVSVVLPQDDVLVLVDADGTKRTSYMPNQFLLDTANLRVLLISSPRSRNDRKWLTQDVRDAHAVFVSKPWSREELLVTSFVYSA